MLDGSGYDALTGISPVVVMVAKRIDPTALREETVRSPHFMMFGVEPDDPRPSWLFSAEQTTQMALRRRQEMARILAESSLDHDAKADAAGQIT